MLTAVNQYIFFWNLTLVTLFLHYFDTNYGCLLAVQVVSITNMGGQEVGPLSYQLHIQYILWLQGLYCADSNFYKLATHISPRKRLQKTREHWFALNLTCGKSGL